jgi:hypothetical protein
MQVMSYFRVADACLDDLEILEKMKKTEVIFTVIMLCVHFVLYCTCIMLQELTYYVQ